MNLENHEERIKQLEKITVDLAFIQPGLLQQIPFYMQAVQSLAEVDNRARNDDLSILRILANSPLMVDEENRQKALLIITRLEQEQERREHQWQQLKSQLPPIVLPPRKDPPRPAGPASSG